jgi:hypothetical protein
VGVYKRFADHDLLHTVVQTTPHIFLTSGSNGWRGNLDLSSSLTLHGGVRGRIDVKASDFSTSGLSVYPLDPLDTLSIDRTQYISGSYPATGSVQLVRARRLPADNKLTDVTAVDWWEEHFNPILGLYDYYSALNHNYFTGSYDFYSLYFKQNTSYQAPVVSYSGSTLSTVSSSYAMEAWIKPLYVTSSAQDFTIMGQRSRWKFYITGSSGRLAFTDVGTTVTSSAVLVPGVWTHVAFTADGSSGSFYVNGSVMGVSVFTGTLSTIAAHVTSSHLSVGSSYVLSGTTGRSDQGFWGFIFDTRIWSRTRTSAQISGSYLTYISGSGSSTLVHYSRFNDGPLSTRHGFTQGSGAFDYSSTAVHGQLINFRSALPSCPIWQPNDNPSFITTNNRINDQLDHFRVVHIPSLFYGRQIATGSVLLTCRAYDNQGIVRVLRDDGRGALYVSGSLTRNIGREDYTGVKWNKVGNVFYSEGLIVITDPSLWDFGERQNTDNPDTSLQVEFKGLQRITSKVIMCRLGAAEFNASLNPTFSNVDVGDPGDATDDRYVPSGNTTYVTAVGLYNEERKLVAVAKLAQPIRKREKDRITIRLKFDL